MHLYSHPDCVSHETPEGHPDRSDRLSFLLEHLEQTGFTQDYPLLEAPPIDDALKGELEAFVAKRKEELPDAWY